MKLPDEDSSPSPGSPVPIAITMNESQEQLDSGEKPRKTLGKNLLSTLKAKRCVGLFKGHGNFSPFEENDQSAMGALKEGDNEDEDDVAEFYDEEAEQEKASLLAAQQATKEREERLEARSQHRAILKIESLRPASAEGNDSSLNEDVEENEPKFVTLPEIVVERNGKTITYPSVIIEKTKGDSGDFSGGDGHNLQDTEEESEEGSPGGISRRVYSPQRHMMMNRKTSPSTSPVKNTRTEGVEVEDRPALSRQLSRQNSGAIILDQRTLQQTRNRRKLRDLLAAPDIKRDAKYVRLKEQVISMLGPLWLRVKHVAILLQYFKESTKFEKYWGSHRVDIVVSLFSRIIDLHNFDFILAELTATEASCLYTRLGWLNIFNPMKPEGSYELCMSRWDERMVAKVLLTLAIHEIGENLIHGAFQWDRESALTPGWVVTPSWLCDESMQRRGYLSITYISKKNCESSAMSAAALAATSFEVDTDFRRALLSTVLIKEEEIRTEVASKKTPDTPGQRTLREHEHQWVEYLYADREIENKVMRIAESEDVS